jgi:hypothetical protein
MYNSPRIGTDKRALLGRDKRLYHKMNHFGGYVKRWGKIMTHKCEQKL